MNFSAIFLAAASFGYVSAIVGPTNLPPMDKLIGLKFHTRNGEVRFNDDMVA